MIKFNHVLILILSVFLLGNMNAQSFVFSPDENIYENDSNKLFLKIDNAAFLKNNEYFNYVVEGYTFIGYWFTPTLQYNPDSKTSINAGLHTLHFSGRDKFFHVKPVLSISRKLTNKLDLVLGTLRYNNNHFMPEPILDPERFYFNRTDEGIQFVYTGNSIKNDIWLSWDRFIYYGDSIQERLTFGNASSFQLIDNEIFTFIVPFWVLLTHQGGQINRPKKPIESLENIGSGLHLSIKTNGFVKSIFFHPDGFLYSRLTSHPFQPYKKGWAVYPTIGLSGTNVLFKTSWWYSDKYINPRGETIYGAESKVTPGFYASYRNLWVTKLAYKKEYSNGLSIGCAFESYYSAPEKLLDYNYSIQIQYNTRFFLKTVKGIN